MARFFELDLLDNRYPALHGMRVVAIATVVQIHVTSIFAFEDKLPFDPAWAGTSLNVFFGMDLFFVLSGFLIGTILLSSIDKAGTQQVLRFWLRRAFRTFPSYYVVLTLLAVIGPLTAAQWRHLPAEYLYATNYVRLDRDTTVMLWGWSLAVEEQFYLAVPLLLFLLWKLRSDRARIALLSSLWLLALAIRLVIYFRWYGGWTYDALYRGLYFKSHTRFDTLVAGVMLAYVHRRWRQPIADWLKNPGPRAALSIVALACLWVLMTPEMFGPMGFLTVRVFNWGTLTTIMYFAWILLVLTGDGWIVRVLSAPLFRRVATLGYGVYLVHIPLCDAVIRPAARVAVKSWHAPMVVVWPLSVAGLLAVSWGAAYVLHLVVEKPSLALRDRWAP